MPEDGALDAADEAGPIDRNMRLRLEVFGRCSISPSGFVEARRPAVYVT
jgi:hypothetical protein